MINVSDDGDIREYNSIVIDYSRDKDLPEQGRVMLTKKGFYKKDGEDSPQETFARAATCYCFGDYDLAQRIYDAASKKWFTNASPVLTNAVNIDWPTFTKDQFEEAGDWLEENIEPEGMPISCFLPLVPDTKEGLVETRSETEWLSMMGGGVGVYMSNRAPDEKSTGVMAHLKGYDADALAYKQTESRRGSIAAYLDITHPEILAFIDMRNPTGGDVNKKCMNLNHGINVTDDFMVKALTGQKYELIDPKHGNTGQFLNAKEVWELILDSRYATGEPYLHFIDTVNRNLPRWITKPTYHVRQSNLCVAPETQVLTRKGYFPIAELEDCDVEIWNGESWSEVYPKKTGTNQPLLKVTTSAGQVLECTEYHKWYVFTGYGKPFVEKRTYELLQGDKLIKFDLPVVQGHRELCHAYDNGFFSGDGSHSVGKPIIYLYGDKQNLQPRFTSIHKWYKYENQDRSTGWSDLLKDKFFVPGDDYTIESRLNWLAGYLDADGCVYRNGTNEAITASSVNYTFLQELQLMLQTLGVSCKISKMKEEGYYKLPANDGTGEDKDFLCQTVYRLLITSYDSFKLISLGLNTSRLSIKLRRPQRDAKQFNKIVSVVDEGRFDDTYCFTESKRGMGMFNGILTGNCSEITLMTSNKRTAVCCLSSLNLEKHEEWKDTTLVADLTRYLDNVLEYFIRLAPPVLKRAVYSAYKERAIGIGTLGLHSYLQQQNIAFASQDAARVCHYVYKDIKEKAVESSLMLGAERGEASDCKGSGMRNSHLLAVAPNASSASIVGASPSAEPWAANAFVAQGRAGSFLIKNVYLEKLLDSKGQNTKEVWESITSNEGSVAHLDCLSPEEKLRFQTFSEIDQRWVIELAAIRQSHICQSQSLNMKVKKDITRQEFSDLHVLAWVKGVKTLYYCRAEQAQKTALKINTATMEGSKPLDDFSTCLSCEG